MDERKSFYRRVFALVLPMALQNLINVSVQSADVIMLGRVNEKALSAASLGGQVNFLFSLFLFGLASGASVLCAQYWGKQDLYAIETIAGICLRFALIAGIIVSVLTFLFPGAIMQIMTSDPEVAKLGISYLRILCLSFLFMAVSNIYLNIMRSMEKVIISTVTYAVSLVVNVIVNVCLIFGLGPFPKMGVAGAAMGTLIARIVECVIAYYHYKKYNNLITINFSLLLRKNKVLSKDFITIAAPVVLNELFWAGGMSAGTAILGHLGSGASAANAVVQVVRQLALVVAFGIANATAIMIGKAIGEKREDLAIIYGKRFTELIAIFGLLASLVILGVRPLILNFMDLTPEAKQYLSFMLYLMSVYAFVQAFNTMYVVGVFRGGGDTKFGFYTDICGLWGGSVLFGFLAAFVFHQSVYVVYAIILIDEYLKFPFIFTRYRSKKWLNNVTR